MPMNTVLIRVCTTPSLPRSKPYGNTWADVKDRYSTRLTAIAGHHRAIAERLGRPPEIDSTGALASPVSKVE
jgi:hypothetical protein